MTILAVNNNHFIKGGSDSVYFSTADLLRGAGHRVIPFAAQGEKPAEDTPYASYFPLAADTGNPRPRDMPRFLRNRAAARSLNALLEVEQDVALAHLHIYYGRLTPTILPVLRRRDIPVVQTLHDFKLVCPVYALQRDGVQCERCVTGTTLNALVHRCKNGSLVHSAAMLAEYWISRLQGDMRHVARFICVCEFQRQVLLRAGLPADRLVTLHNFVDPNAFTPAPDGARGDYILYFGRIERSKGVHTLVSTVQRTGHKLVLAGSGSWARTLTQEIAGTPNITYRGFTAGQALRDLIAGARVVVLPSECPELCPMTVLEAKASGVPVIGARMGGIPELIRPGIDGFLFDSGDSDSLAEAFAVLDAADCAALGAAARADVLERFAPDIHLERLLGIFREAGMAEKRAA